MMQTKNSSNLAVVLVAGIIVCLMNVPGWAQYGGGSGTEGDPFLISDPDHMQAIGADPNNWDKHFKLIEDIDLRRFTGTQFNIIGYSDDEPFNGVFDGNGHKIHNFTYYTTSGKNGVGLFGYLGSDGEIRDLGLEDPNIASAGDYVSGLVGRNSGGISNCYATGAVTGGSYLGGLVGWNGGTISNCYATGAVIGDERIGGLVGENTYSGTISNCYATGAVNGCDSSGLGGLVGWNWSGTISNCYWDENSTGLSYSHGGRKKTTPQMKEAQTYLGWNDGSWVIDDGNDSPHLSWEEGAQGLPAITTDYPARTYPGNGEDQPFELDSSEDLLCMSQRTIDWDKNFILTGDVDMNLVMDYYPPTGFNGYIDGAGYAVINLTVDANVIGNNSQLGLIGRLGNGGRIEYLGVEEVNIIGGDYSQYLGGLVGYIEHGTISNCYAAGAVTGSDDSDSLGGLVGYNSGTISNSYATGAVSGDEILGGLVGWNEYNGTISNCYTTGAVTGGDSLGGLVGWNRDGIISNCYATGAVSGGVGSYSLGGLVGGNSGTISNCYATGAVTGGVDSRNVGGLVGGGSSGTISNCYWDENSTGLSYSHGGRKKTTAQMKDTQTYVGWNGGLWVIDDGNDYPHLWWEAGAQGLPGITTNYPARTYPGNGQNQPFELDSSEDLLCMSQRPIDWEKNFILIGDIDMNTVADYYPPSGFNGYIDGGGYAVINLTVDAHVIGNNCQLGLIGRLGDGGHLENLGVKEVNIIGVDNSLSFGGLVGYNYNGAISNCYATGAVTGGDDSWVLGGLVGGTWHGTISNCYATGAVTGGDDSRYLSGLVGDNNGTISNSYATGAVTGGDNWLGGLVGKNDGDISNCYATGAVTGGDSLGGLVGWNRGDISDCYATGAVIGDYNLGGLVGWNDDGTINNCYATGAVTGDDSSGDLGGLVGKISDGLISNCYAIGEVSGDDLLGGLVGWNNSGVVSNCYATGVVSGGVGSENLGGLVGKDWNRQGYYTKSFWDETVNGGLSGIGNISDPNVIGETTENLQKAVTFTSEGWDFVGEEENGNKDIWYIPEGMDYPKLSWPFSLLTVNVIGGNGSITPTSGTYGDGEVVLLTASPDQYYQVKSWTGTDDDLSTDTTNTVTMTMTSDKTVTVEFEKIIYQLNTGVIVGNGLVEPNSAPYEVGEVVSLTATPDRYYKLKSWSGTDDDLSTDTTNTVTMTSDKMVTVEFEKIPETVDIGKMTLKTSRKRGILTSDSFYISGAIHQDVLAIIADPNNDITVISISVVHPIEALVWGHLETLDSDRVKINEKRSKLIYKAGIKKGESGRITAFSINLEKGNFFIRARKVDLTGLRSPVIVEIQIGDFYGLGAAYDGEVLDSGEELDVINGKKPIPLNSLSGVADALLVDKYKFKLGAKKPNTDYLKVQGAITVRDTSVDIASEDVIVSWGDYSVTLPANNMYRIGEKKVFKFKKPKGSDSSVAAAVFDLEKCTFKIIISKADIGSQESPFEFGISFGTFSEKVVINLP